MTSLAFCRNEFMKRDCGEGELVPHCYEVVWCVGQSDREFKKKHQTLQLAQSHFEELVSQFIHYSNAGLYVLDKKGYANCLLSKFMSETGEIQTSMDRIAEL